MAQTAHKTWLTAEEVRQMLGIGRTKVYEIFATEEELEVVRLGRCLRVNRASLDRWLWEHRYPAWRRDTPTADHDGS